MRTFVLDNSIAQGWYDRCAVCGPSNVWYLALFAIFQSIVPHILLDHFISMTDLSRVQTVDSEIAYHCAYSLPAVAFTLGRRNWPYIRDLFQSLARDMQVAIQMLYWTSLRWIEGDDPLKRRSTIVRYTIAKMNWGNRPGPVARMIAKQAAGRSVHKISEWSISIASALGFSVSVIGVL